MHAVIVCAQWSLSERLIMITPLGSWQCQASEDDATPARGDPAQLISQHPTARRLRQLYG